MTTKLEKIIEDLHRRMDEDRELLIEIKVNLNNHLSKHDEYSQRDRAINASQIAIIGLALGGIYFAINLITKLVFKL